MSLRGQPDDVRVDVRATLDDDHLAAARSRWPRAWRRRTRLDARVSCALLPDGSRSWSTAVDIGAASIGRPSGIYVARSGEPRYVVERLESQAAVQLLEVVQASDGRSVRGRVRVQNHAYEKRVFVRLTLDSWLRTSTSSARSRRRTAPVTTFSLSTPTCPRLVAAVARTSAGIASSSQSRSRARARRTGPTTAARTTCSSSSRSSPRRVVIAPRRRARSRRSRGRRRRCGGMRRRMRRRLGKGGQRRRASSRADVTAPSTTAGRSRGRTTCPARCGTMPTCSPRCGSIGDDASIGRRSARTWPSRRRPSASNSAPSVTSAAVVAFGRPRPGGRS